ncbi:hypothetical protein BDV29DRAFT_152137 [Aspergillus leporis]|jgi:hypothetical protein|uniref:Aminoglycoside phosphotransferase domain-containing protein n=1 Tax=Aspergillus leporis TaxID=41062 RepID=A0A5N5XHH8_9EURO|nr:hypothetical protein BDV29DRAFT_152137 [Aspergillus leporis]
MTSTSLDEHFDEEDAAEHTSSGSPERDEYELFSPVMASIRRDRLPKYASTIRENIHHSNKEKRLHVIELESPIYGSYHVLYPMTFNDGVIWLLKVPANGTPDRFQDSDARALRSEALTMRALRRETTIPLPEVFAYSDTCNNDLNCPFILMNHVNGKSLYKVWYDRTSPKEVVQARRARCLRDLAAAMVQLEKFSFGQGGSLAFDDCGLLTRIGPLRLVNTAAMRERLRTDDSDESTTYLELQPLSETKDYYTALLSHRRDRSSGLEKGALKLLRMFIDWIPQLSDGREPFVLSHPDLDMQNVLVSEDGMLQAIIDWDGVSAVPRSIGNERYPSWLTRDWDPATYSWNGDMEWGQCTWEDSPDTLKLYRSIYAGFIGSHQSESAATGNHLTTNSLIFEKLLIAVNDPPRTVQILDKIFRTIAEILEKDMLPLSNMSHDGGNSRQEEMGNHDNKLEDFDFYSVSCALDDGRLSEDHIKLLKLGFDALLQHSSKL